MKNPFPIQQVFEHYARPAPPVGLYQYCPFCGRPLQAAPQPACPGCDFVQYRNPAPAVSILIMEEDKVLLGKRHGEPGRGAWALPSGYIEFEEDFLSAAVREAKEETGLEVAIHTLLNVTSSFVTPRYHFLGIYVAASITGGTMEAGDDLDALAWHPLHGPLPEMGFAEDVKIIELFGSGFTGIPVQAGIWR